MEVLIVPVIFGLIVAVAVAASASSRRYEAQWKTAADRLQLGFQPGRVFSRPKISGSIGDLTVNINVSSSSGGSTNSPRTRYRVGYPPLGLDLKMARQTGFAKAAAMFGVSDIKLGDTEFDEAFSIRTSDPQRLAVRLSPAARRVLLSLVEGYRSVKITDEQVSYEKSGIDRETGTVVTTAQRLIEAARVMQGASAEPTRPDSEISGSEAIPPPPPVREATPPPPPILQPDPFDTRPPVFEPLPPRPPIEAESKPKQPAPPPPSTSVPSGVTVTEIAEALFAKRGLSFQIAAQFEDKYLGRSVNWAGEVRDIITGIGPNDPTRVTVLVTTVQHELFGSVNVEAVASISGRPPRGLTSGNQVKVRGTLSDIDAMGRSLFIEDARVKKVD